MALTNAFPAGTVLTDAELNESVALGARYEQNAAQTINNVTDTPLRYQNAIHTNTDVVASGTGNTFFALQRAGFWLVTAGIRFLGAAGGLERHLFLMTGVTMPGVAQRIAHQVEANAGANPVSLGVSTVIRTTGVTSVTAGGFQNSGGGINTDAFFGGSSHITFTWLGPA